MNTATRPGPLEFDSYYADYIGLVPDGDIIATLTRQIDETVAILQRLSPATAVRCPAPGEWSPLDIAVHIADTERVIAYRALWFARGGTEEMPSMEPDPFAAEARANGRTIADVCTEMRTVRAATLSLFAHLREEVWSRRGVASTAKVSVRALAWICAGHELHHRPDLLRALAANSRPDPA